MRKGYSVQTAWLLYADVCMALGERSAVAKAWAKGAYQEVMFGNKVQVDEGTSACWRQHARTVIALPPPQLTYCTCHIKFTHVIAATASFVGGPFQAGEPPSRVIVHLLDEVTDEPVV